MTEFDFERYWKDRQKRELSAVLLGLAFALCALVYRAFA